MTHSTLQIRNHAIEISIALLMAVKLNKDYAVELSKIKQYNLSDLVKDLGTDNLKIPFWLNIYNAYFQLARKKWSVSKKDVYKAKFVRFDDFSLSLDEIEHGILRRNRWKYSLGYISNPFVSRIVKQLYVDKIDPRIHFALNCGAKSCPPIGFYNNDMLDQKLKLAELSFIEAETNIDHSKKVIYTNRILLWYKADFGGKASIIKRLENVFNESFPSFKLKYNPYSWDEMLDNYL